jgi:signal transduction histidine kinase
MTFNSLTVRLLSSALFYAMLALPLSGYAIYSQFRQTVEGDFDHELHQLVDNIHAESFEDNGAEPNPPRSAFDPLYGITESGYYWEIKPAPNNSGKRLVSNSLASEVLPAVITPTAKVGNLGKYWLDAKGPFGQYVRIASAEFPFGEDPASPRYVYSVARDLRYLETKIREFRIKLMQILALAGGVLVGVSLLQSWFILHPLGAVERGLQAVRTGKAEKLEGELPAEIEPLQRELNALITSNHDIIERARTQVGNLAHSLKTPLAVIINEARDDESIFAERVSGQAEVMRSQINHYLERARIAARAGTLGRITEVRPILDGLQRTLERIYRDKPVKITVSCPPRAAFQGEKQDLEEALGNLFDNACKWSRGTVTVTTDVTVPLARSEAPRLILTIEDDGPGLSAEDRGKLGKRGVRLDESTPGTGLGLSIVADLAQSYRGTFRLEASDLGGLKAVIELPAVAI